MLVECRLELDEQDALELKSPELRAVKVRVASYLCIFDFPTIRSY
jgi:hypothetical protein